MTWDNETCDDCAEQTLGGPMLRDEVWATIAKPEAVRCDPVEPDLFSWADVPCFQQVETFLCFACIERRLGRRLVQEDLTTAPWNAGWIDMDSLRDQLRVRDAGMSDGVEKWMARRARGRRLLPHERVINETDARRDGAA
jgi:hypothetical protein